jgi:hypothetical protein
MSKVKFDRVCKELLNDLAYNLGFETIQQFNIFAQKQIEKTLGFTSKLRADSIDVAWTAKLPKYGVTKLAKEVFSDVIVAWEVDKSSNPNKTIRSSIDNLNRCNPRLGIELLLIGNSKITQFPKKLENAIEIAQEKKCRIVVIHDVHFAKLFSAITGRHPERLYEVYIQACKEKPKIIKPLKEELEKLVNNKKLDKKFTNEFRSKFLEKLGA